jgi:hypothetical protein
MEKAMKVYALCRCYNEELLLSRAFKWIYPVVDKIVINDGLLSPFGDLSQSSTDATLGIINAQLANDSEDKIIFTRNIYNKTNNREEGEGKTNNNILDTALKNGLEHGDLIFNWDVDEFWNEENFVRIVEMFRTNDKINHIPIEEWQFAYNTKLAFKASHDGRFMRYVNGSRYKTCTHYVYPDGKDITKDYTYLTKREDTNMCHLCWVKHPKDIREKVLSFKRISFTNWYNHCYLKWPLNSELAYHNNTKIAPYHGSGFAEGQHSRLELFNGILPEVIQDLDIDWITFIKNNFNKLRI